MKVSVTPPLRKGALDWTCPACGLVFNRDHDEYACGRKLRRELRDSRAEGERLRGALAESGAILESLQLSVRWELCDEIKAAIAEVLPKVHAALTPASPGLTP